MPSATTGGSKSRRTFTLNQLNGERWKSFDVDEDKCDEFGRVKCSDLEAIIGEAAVLFFATEPVFDPPESEG